VATLSVLAATLSSILYIILQLYTQEIKKTNGGFPRIPLLRARVNKGERRKGRGSWCKEYPGPLLGYASPLWGGRLLAGGAGRGDEGRGTIESRLLRGKRAKEGCDGPA
jgi:hypothetical protein